MELVFLFISKKTSPYLLLLLFSHSVMSSSSETPWTVALQAPLSMGVGSHFLLQGIFLTQGSNQCLLLGR